MAAQDDTAILALAVDAGEAALNFADVAYTPEQLGRVIVDCDAAYGAIQMATVGPFAPRICLGLLNAVAAARKDLGNFN